MIVVELTKPQYNNTIQTVTYNARLIKEHSFFRYGWLQDHISEIDPVIPERLGTVEAVLDGFPANFGFEPCGGCCSCKGSCCPGQKCDKRKNPTKTKPPAKEKTGEADPALAKNQALKLQARQEDQTV